MSTVKLKPPYFVFLLFCSRFLFVIKLIYLNIFYSLHQHFILYQIQYCKNISFTLFDFSGSRVSIPDRILWSYCCFQSHRDSIWSIHCSCKQVNHYCVVQSICHQGSSVQVHIDFQSHCF